MRMEAGSGDHIKTWHHNTMKARNVNWETKHTMIRFEEDNVAFSCLTADCKVRLREAAGRLWSPFHHVVVCCTCWIHSAQSPSKYYTLIRNFGMDLKCDMVSII